MSVVACEEGCSAHSEEVHRSIEMMQAYRSTAWGSGDRGYNGSAGWNQGGTQGYSAWTLVPALGPGQAPHHQQQCNIPWSAASVPAAMSTAGLPATPAMQDEDLLSVFINFISQFTASLDGKPDASNPYLKHYLPHCLSSRLLTHVAIYSAACFLTDTGHIERTAAMAHKGRVIALLNEHIRAQGQAAASDEVIAGVLQIVLDEWLWGSAKDLKAHLRGLRDMIWSRGGFRSLGLHGLLTKLAITVDAAIALSLETPPFLRGGPEFEFRDTTATSSAPLRLALNTPLIPNPVRFASCADALHIQPSAASILDDMRFLLAAVLALPDAPTTKELQKIHTTSAWLYERVSGLPEDAPGAKGKSVGSSGGWDGKTSENMHPPPSQQQQQRQHQQHPPSPPPTTSNLPSPHSDPIYQTIRLAALLYTHTIQHRLPFSKTVTTTHFLRLWTTAWRVPLSTWRTLLGVFTWVLLPLVSGGGAGAQPQDRFVKGVMNICLFQMGLESWAVGGEVVEAGGRLQRWLAGGGGKDGDVRERGE
ncbi:uncharacterized protein C8A04DRAFT_11647 [Dichotomopilus funicola]|uniref:Uncharacterized protein n=1 Tax=Dichotomopilus funicola TaxID=1934379 RepID=A0AAN6V3P6_9PEZI|nr:hypothetical protein C8A04DRAFT_11647 [Dichotomopilus funicola]